MGVVAVLAEVFESNDITRLVIRSAFVGNPYLNFRNLQSARYVRHCFHCFLEVVAEEMREEEVAVLIVVVSGDVEACHLCSALAADCLRFAVLL